MEVNKKIYGYDAPQVEVMELYVEGVLCMSTENPGDEEYGGHV